MAVENNIILPVSEESGGDFNKALDLFLKIQTAVMGDGDINQPLPESDVQLTTVGGWMESLQDLVEAIDKESFQNKLELEDYLEDFTRKLEELQQLAHENTKVKDIHTLRGMRVYCLENDLLLYNDLVAKFANVSENF